ncbi:MAG: CPBP family intramembrane metalloprotease [Gammaproteobacteria bacterium]|nr:CPBP family intramembrane metalloprotease [Gammaproteobacteria bacterium]
MRAAGWFLLAIGGTLLAAALLAWPVFELAHAAWPELAFHRVVTRFWQLLMLGGIALCVWRLGLRGRADWGYGAPRPRFLREAASGLAAGLAMALPAAGALVLLGVRQWLPAPDAGELLGDLGSDLATALAVALLEETFFRGLMYRGIERESGATAAIVLTSIVYAAVHFLGRTPIAAAEVDWGSGLVLLAGALDRFASPLEIADAFATLLVVGLLLGAVRHRTGSIGACFGLHLAWVWVIQATLDVTALDPESRQAALVSSYDGFTGWLVAGWAALMLIGLWLLRRRINPGVPQPPR